MDVSDGSWIQSGYNTLDLSTQQRYRYAGVTRTVSYAYSDRDNLPLTATFYGGGGKVTNSYDDLTRLSQKSYRANGSDTGVTATYHYVDWTDTNNTNRTSGTVRGIIYGYDRSQLTISDLYYDYDGAGNVTAERAWGTNSKPLREQYTYDGKNQLIRHDSKTQDATFIYTYDNAGNIKSVKKYPYNDTTGTPEETRTFSYDDSSWKDLLTAYNGHAITHDGMGNMTSYNGSTYTWEGRQLKTIQGGGNTYSYTYNADGIRTSKTINGTTTEYFLNGSQILAQKTGSETLWFFYDSTGQRVAVLCGGVLYYYVYNLQGDVIALAGATTGRILVKYSYDAWGNCTVTDDRTSTHVGEKNPFRYRGYYYDDETGLYYLNARYYSPEFGRFISADVYVSTGQGVLGANMFAYCNNNPVMYADSSGTRMCCCVNVADGGGKSIRDITNELNELMDSHVNELVSYYKETVEQFKETYTLAGGELLFPNSAGVLAFSASLEFFRQKETNGGEWDLKETPTYSKHNHFYYNGRLVSGEDVGNIHFGYVGASLFPNVVLFAGAGWNQAKRDFHLDYLPYWFDEPRDFEMANYGISLYISVLKSIRLPFACFWRPSPPSFRITTGVLIPGV